MNNCLVLIILVLLSNEFQNSYQEEDHKTAEEILHKLIREQKAQGVILKMLKQAKNDNADFKQEYAFLTNNGSQKKKERLKDFSEETMSKRKLHEKSSIGQPPPGIPWMKDTNAKPTDKKNKVERNSIESKTLGKKIPPSLPWMKDETLASRKINRLAHVLEHRLKRKIKLYDEIINDLHVLF